MGSESNTIYFMPCKPSSIYINVTAACLNDCLFCIKRKGGRFFGQELLLGSAKISPEETLSLLTRYRNIDRVSEVVFCGMGEPLLEYSYVLEVSRKVKAVNRELSIRIDTSGLFWSVNPKLDILPHIDILSISLNAECQAVYEALCRPKIENAYQVLLDFLSAVKDAELSGEYTTFPEVRLSIVDTSEWDYLPVLGRAECRRDSFPHPDVSACKRIADSFGWKLAIKRLFRDSEEDVWMNAETRKKCIEGVPLERCRKCEYRH